MSGSIGSGTPNPYLGYMSDLYGYGDPQAQDQMRNMRNQYQNVSQWAEARRLKTPLEIWKEDFESSVKAFAKDQDGLAVQRTRIAVYAATGIFFLLLFEGYLAYFAP